MNNENLNLIYDEIEFEDLKGQVFTKIEVNETEDYIKFFTENDEYLMAHYQHCCESVSIKDICGPIQDLIGSSITLAEKRSNSNQKGEENYERITWTFYEIANKNVSITITWFGESNGYYSEDVELYKKTKE